MEELVSKNYTLEKHLKKLSEIDKEYEILYSIWDLNKRNLSNGLNTISASFPNYSLHDISHSMTVINNIQLLLGEERIKRLGATDTFLLLMAGLTHDIGMILTYHMLEKKWVNKNIEEKLYSFSRCEDRIISSAANTILVFHEQLLKGKEGKDENVKKDYYENDYKFAVEIKDAVVILTAELFRDEHASLSAENIKSNEEFRQLANNFYADLLPNRFLDLLSDVALLHGKDFEYVKSLHKEANGYRSDKCHPSFIACMIRLGDLLDFDSNRFNLFSNSTIKEMPETSILHKQKHEAVKHMLISPTSIEAELNCPNEEVYRVARSWFDWLEKEVESQRREWAKIAPDDLGGFPPTVSRDSIRILYKGIKASPELLNLKFAMSQEKVFSILKGGGIYKEPGFVFIREIVQNAFDATKIQMWNDIKNGSYDILFSKGGKDVNRINFPDDIPSIIYGMYPVKLSIKWKDSKKEVLHFECEDHGTGISEKTLVRMTQHVGESRKIDSDYDSLCNMPYWLKPTAAFGIGLQSIFFGVQSFEVETKYDGETSKRIIFRSSAENQYSSIINENINHKRGTTIKIDIPKTLFPRLFGTTFDFRILDLAHPFDGDGDDIYLAKIDDFVKNTFEQINDYTFIYDAEDAERGFIKQNLGIEQPQKLETIDEHFRCSYQIVDGYVIFDIDENEFGSQIQIAFSRDNYKHRLRRLLYLRDVLISNAKMGYWKLDYCSIFWNLSNQTTDKIVDISRDNLTYEGNKWISDTLLFNLLPKIVKIIGPIFNEIYKTQNTEIQDINEQYLHYCYTVMACNENCYDTTILETINIPTKIATYEGKEIKASCFFESKELYLVHANKHLGDGFLEAEDQEKTQSNYQDLLSNKYIVWGGDYLHGFLMYNYICTDVLAYNKDCNILKLERIETKPKEIIPINCTAGDTYLKALDESYSHGCSRRLIYGIKKYSRIVVKNIFVTGFEFFPNYSVCSIYNPFSRKAQTEELLKSTEGINEIDLFEYVENIITNYLTPSFLKIVKDNNINKTITDDEIKKEYSQLITDYIKYKRNNN